MSLQVVNKVWQSKAEKIWIQEDDVLLFLGANMADILTKHWDFYAFIYHLLCEFQQNWIFWHIYPRNKSKDILITDIL